MVTKNKGKPTGYLSMYDRWVKANKPDDVKKFVADHQPEVLPHIRSLGGRDENDSDGSELDGSGG